jgi:hypothetical protein
MHGAPRKWAQATGTGMRVTNGELDHVALGRSYRAFPREEKATGHEPTGETSLSLTACRFMGSFLASGVPSGRVLGWNTIWRAICFCSQNITIT